MRIFVVPDRTSGTIGVVDLITDRVSSRSTFVMTRKEMSVRRRRRRRKGLI